MTGRKAPSRPPKPQKPEQPNILAGSRPKNTAYKPLTRPGSESTKPRASKPKISNGGSLKRRSFIDDEASVSDEVADSDLGEEDDNNMEDFLAADDALDSYDATGLAEESDEANSDSEILTSGPAPGTGTASFRSGSSLMDLDSQPLAPKPKSRPRNPSAPTTGSTTTAAKPSRKPSNAPSKPTAHRSRPSKPSKPTSRPRPRSSSPPAPPDPAPPSSDPSPSIPPALLSRLLHASLSSTPATVTLGQKPTRISKEAETAVAEYMKTFVREAIWRAKAVGEVEGGEGGRGPDADVLGVEGEGVEGRSRGGDRWLEVEDLERVAPQLLLDF